MEEPGLSGEDIAVLILSTVLEASQWSRCSQHQAMSPSWPTPMWCSPFAGRVDQAQQLRDFEETLLVSLVEALQQDHGDAEPLPGVQLATESGESVTWLPSL